MARPRRLQVVLVRCPCGLCQAAPMWRHRGGWWLRCLLCGPVEWRARPDVHRSPAENRRLLRAA